MRAGVDLERKRKRAVSPQTGRWRYKEAAATTAHVGILVSRRANVMEGGTEDLCILSQLYSGDPKNVPDGEGDMQKDHREVKPGKTVCVRLPGSQ